MPYNHYLQISEERYDLLCERFEKFMLNVVDDNKEPFKLFDPLSSQQKQELELIREVSKDLKNKKEEDIKKAAEAALEAKNAAKTRKETVKPEETSDTEKNETEEPAKATLVEN